MDSKLILIVKKLFLAGALIFAGSFVFGNIDIAKSVISGYSVFSINILVLALIFRILLDKNKLNISSSLKKLALLGLGLKIPVLVAVLYYLIRVLNLPVLNIFVGSILGMFVTGWLFFEDYLQNLAD